MTNSSRWITGDDACSVEITADVLDTMIAMADETHPLETGAALYGHYSADERIAFVEGMAPTPRDSERGRFHFRRGVVGLAAFFRRLFKQTRGESYYIGEFHSHPGGLAVPSGTDDASQLAIAADRASQCRAPVLVLLGGVPGDRQFGVFVHTRHHRRYALKTSGRLVD